MLQFGGAAMHLEVPQAAWDPFAQRLHANAGRGTAASAPRLRMHILVNNARSDMCTEMRPGQEDSVAQHSTKGV